METIDDKIKKSKEKLGLKIPCTLEVLLPVHIGSGVKLAKDLDFYADGSKTYIVPQSALMQYLEENPHEIDNFNDQTKRKNILKNINIPSYCIYNLIASSREIFEFERDGNGKPYIPGSSLKGAIRTIILKNLFDDLPSQKQQVLLSEIQSSRATQEWAADTLIKELLGRDSNHNLMRMIQVFDITFSSLDLSKVLILSLTNSNGSTYGWKKFGKGNPNVSLNENPTSLIVESLPIGLKSEFSIHIDDFLFKNNIAKDTLKFAEINLASLSVLINNYSRKSLIKEKEFFAKLNTTKTLNDVLKEIDNTIAIIPKETSTEEKTEFVIRMSWGSGWKGMTGDYLEKDWIDIFRKKYRQGKVDREGNIFPIFPKTRKIVFERDIPKYLTGWVKIKLNDNIAKPNKLELPVEQNENNSGELNLSKLSQFGRVGKIKK